MRARGRRNGGFNYRATALTGGLAGAVVNQSWQFLQNWRRKPELSIEFDETIEGCVVENVPFQNAAAKTSGKKKFLRICVFNKGRSTALDVQVIIAKISRKGSPKWDFEGEVLDALWSISRQPFIQIYRSIGCYVQWEERHNWQQCQ